MEFIGFSTGNDNININECGSEKSIIELFPEYEFVILASIKKSQIFGNIGIWGLKRFDRLRTQCPRIIYLQKFNERWWLPRIYLFIVDENRKWGLVTRDLKMLIEPQYDHMKWVKEDKLIEVKSGSKTMLIDTRNNYCI